MTRLRLGTFVRPAVETGIGAPRVEEVLGYVARTAAGTLLLDTGMGSDGGETDAWYRPRQVPIERALRQVGLGVADIDLVVNCHLHFDHIGGNPSFPGTPIYCQRAELDAARGAGYTFPELVDFAGVRWELLDGETELVPGVHIIPTPGHVEGHQSVVLECGDGSVVLAGQAHDSASMWSSDVLASRGRGLGHVDPLPEASPWMDRILQFDPRRVVFAHDSSVWIP